LKDIPAATNFENMPKVCKDKYDIDNTIHQIKSSEIEN